MRWWLAYHVLQDKWQNNDTLVSLNRADICPGIQLLFPPPTGCLDLLFPFLYQILDFGVTIHTVAFSDSADLGLEELALSTGGKSYFSLDDDTSNALTEAFLDIGEYLSSGESFSHIAVSPGAPFTSMDK